MAATRSDNEAIFHAARDISDPDRRREYVRDTCGGDEPRVALIEAMLAVADSPDSLLDHPAIGLAADATQCVPPNPEADASLDFLAPSDKPDMLGRLGHYEILEIIGRGGMGIVLRAFDEKLHRVVAVKVMAAQLATNAAARRRFAREAQAQAAVSHDHIVTIHAVEADSPRPYLVMHYVAGLSLQERLDRDGPLELHEILRIGLQTASGLTAAHAQGLIHRDIKPANILLENGVERVKITDFGLARVADEASVTYTGAVAGTPHYMSPEQAEGKQLDQRTDLFSLGSVLYTMCTGRAPFRASGTMSVLKRVCEETPTAIRETNPEIPDWLVAIIDKLHAKDPVERFQTAAEVAELLGRHLAHVQHPSVAPLPAVTVEKALRCVPSGSRNATQEGPESSHRRPWAVAAAALLFCVLGGLSLTEATGVTQFTSTVIRILTPDGTLAVEVNDAAVKVTIEGDGGLVITGAGPQEFRLEPGSYRVHANKDGQRVPLERELVSITTGGRETVRVKLEAAAAPASAVIQNGAFVLLGGKGVAERKFDTLTEAVASSSDGDTIEVRGNGPFVSDGAIANHPLVIRAGTGYTPSILLGKESAGRNVPLFGASNGRVVLEGLELMRVGGAQGQVEDRFPQLLLAWDHGSLHIANCRLICKADSVFVQQGAGFTSRANSLSVRNCLLSGNIGTESSMYCESGGRYSIDNCVCAIGGIGFGPADPDVRDVTIEVRNNTLVGNCLNLTLFFKPNLPGAGEADRPLRLVFSGNVARWDMMSRNQAFLFFHQAQFQEPLPAAQAEAFLPHLVTLDEKQNVYRTGTPMLRLVTDWKPLEGTRGQDLADWNRFWGQKNTGSVEGEIRFQGGDLTARARSAPENLTAEDFRLRADSAGYRAGPDGKDLGADVDLVGPGAAYERWKKTPEYQVWLKNTGQQRAEVPQADDRAAVEEDIKKMGERIEKSPDDHSARIARAHLYTRQRQWRAAADDLGEAGEALLDNPADAFLYAILLVHLRESDLHRQFCERMLDRFASTKDVWTANCLVKSCLLRPGIVDPSSLPVSLLSEDREFATKEPPWVLREARALVAYRSGKLDEARRLVRETLALPVYKEDPLYAPRALSILAMATHKLGDAPLARDLYEQAKQQFDKNQLAPGHPATICWAFADILRREAAKELGLAEETSLDDSRLRPAAEGKAEADAAKRELAKWQGEWANADFGRLVINGERWSSYPKIGLEVVSTIKILEVTDEMTHMLLLNQGVDGKVRTIQTILRVDGDSLHNCGTFGSVRPTEFANKSGWIYTQWKRVAKAPP